MKINMLALLGLAMLCAFMSFAQSNPPNDNFSDRIALNGDFILFSGNLQGATREQNEISAPFLSNGATQTVWWTWTPTQAETAIIQVLFAPKQARGNDAIAVYSLDSVSNGQFIAGTRIDNRMPEIFLSFHAEPGTNYQIQLAGTDSTSFFLRLIASNSPSIIIEQPRDQTVTVGDSALFTVLAAGVPPFGYQWQFNGTNLPGETVAMLGLDNCNSNQTGLYTAVITNALGAITSAPAFLMVTETDTRPLLRAVQGGSGFTFQIIGDHGRRYRILSSTDLANWAPEASFPSFYFSDFDTSVKPLRSVINSFDYILLSVPQTGPRKFIRATPFHSANETCTSRLKRYRFAALLYAYDHYLTGSDGVDFLQRRMYMKPGDLYCPLGGTYVSGGAVLMNVVCTIPGHSIQDQ